MKKLKITISFVSIVFLVTSCDFFKSKDDYQSLVKKIAINPKYEMQPPIAKNIFIQELEKPDDNGNNIKFIAEFEKQDIKEKYLAIMLNNKKVVLRDDGKGADEVKDDNKFSLNLNENLSEIKSELNQRQKLTLTNKEVVMFENRSMKIVNKEKIERFSNKQFIKGKSVLIPNDLFKIPKSLADQKKTLMITDLSVVQDPARTFNPCTSTGNPNGVWTFGALMRQMASPNSSSIASDLQVSNFVRNWMNTWKINQTVNGEILPARSSIQNLITSWENKSSVSSGGVLNMRFAPFKLIAIVNRLDLRGNSGYGFSNAGEGRFVFNALTSSCNSQEFTIIFEYGINKKSCSAVRAFAQEWNNLNSMTLGSATYNSALENITNQFVLSGTNPSKPNQNSINQIRTNEIALSSPWEFREFNLNTSGQLELVTVKQEPHVKYNGNHSTVVSPVAEVEKLVNWINSNTSPILSNNYEVPLNLPSTSTAFRGGHSVFPTNNTGQIWNGRGTSGSQFINNDEARHIFSLNTCTSCHGGETNTPFKHIEPKGFGFETTLSGFLTGITLADPANRPAGNPTSRTFNDLLRRENDLANLIANNCINRPIFELAHKLTFNPMRMVH